MLKLLKGLFFGVVAIVPLIVMAAPPTVAEIAAISKRCDLYISLNQTPEKIKVSLKNYFGKNYETRVDSGNPHRVEFLLVEYDAEGKLTFMTVIGSMIVPDTPAQVPTK